MAGDLSGEEAALMARLETNPDDDQTRFELGAARVQRGVEPLR